MFDMKIIERFKTFIMDKILKSIIKYRNIITLLSIAVLLIILLFIRRNDKGNLSYFQNICIGLITFSIPFLWNAYQSILSYKKQASGQKIINILTREYYQKSIELFETFIQYPTAIMVFGGLFIVPKLNIGYGIVIIFTIFFYLAFLPQIFQLIVKYSSTTLDKYLLKSKVYSENTEEDIRNVYKELWNCKDEDIEKDYSIKTKTVFKYYVDRINVLLNSEKYKEAAIYYESFRGTLQNRSIGLIINDIYPIILGCYLQIWKINEDSMNNKDNDDNCLYVHDNIRIINMIIEYIIKLALRKQEMFILFIHLKKHVEENRSIVVNINGQERYYIYNLLEIYFIILFDEIERSKDKNIVWDDFIPKNWKISIKNHESGNIIARIIEVIIFEWIRKRLMNIGEDWDRESEMIVYNMFPDTTPFLLAPILIFIFSPYDPDNKMKSILERKWNFGGIGRLHVGFMDENGNFSQEVKNRINEEDNYTIKLIALLFKNILSKDEVENNIAELKSMDNQLSKKQELKRRKLLKIFEMIYIYYNTQE